MSTQTNHPPAAAAVQPPEIGRHNIEIHENLVHWQRKPLLREVYAGFYREITSRLAGMTPGPIVECGAGIGNLKSLLPNAVATDLFPNPWLDRTENVFALSMPDCSTAAIILFDVFHHLEFPGAALSEIYRTIRPGGRVIIFEPAIGLLGRIALGLFHHEPIALSRTITWNPPAGWNPGALRYYAAQGNAWRIFRRLEGIEHLARWQISEVAYYPAVTWLLSGGFRGPQLCPTFAVPIARIIEHLLAFYPKLFASRMLVVLEKPL